MPVDPSQIQAAQEALDAHVREMVRWHFSPETGCPFWLDWAGKAGWNPATEIKCYADLQRFPHFQDEWLRDLQNEVWIPKQYLGRPFNIFETGGTTGMPKQRIGWDDYKVDYSEFSNKVSDEHFPRNHYWLMVGPTGPRRLRLAIEHWPTSAVRRATLSTWIRAGSRSSLLPNSSIRPRRTWNM